MTRRRLTGRRRRARLAGFAAFHPGFCRRERCLSKQIAGDSGIAEPTVKAHRSRSMRKTNTRSVAELARLADQLALADKSQPF